MEKQEDIKFNGKNTEAIVKAFSINPEDAQVKDGALWIEQKTGTLVCAVDDSIGYGRQGELKIILA